MLIRNIGSEAHGDVEMPGAARVSMAVMVGRADGAPHFALRHFVVAAGGHTPRHGHDYEHEVFVVAGRGTVLVDGREHALSPGDVLYVPARAEHQFRADAAERLEFLCMVPVERNGGGATPGS
jgi:quercetin dioxygenase-like cupin family protein